MKTILAANDYLGPRRRLSSKLLLDGKRKRLYERSAIIAKIGYTRPPTSPNRGAGLFLDSPGACPLRPDTFAGQHGSIPLQEGDRDKLEGCNELNALDRLIWNGRSCSGHDRPNLDTLGFELIDVPKSKVLSTTEGLQSMVDNHPDTIQKHYAELAPRICQATGATAAIAYCHAMRVPSPKGKAQSGFASYAHTDLSHKSWANLLPDLVESGQWSQQGPPGISSDDAKRAAASSRYAIVSAWRYLGPSDKCRSSHLAVLDHRTVKDEGDILPLSLVAHGCQGGNYRLSSSTHNHHEWYYYPEMTVVEMLVFTCFDSNHPAKNTTFANTPIATCIHSAFQDPYSPKNEPPRQSIDIRFLLIWD